LVPVDFAPCTTLRVCPPTPEATAAACRAAPATVLDALDIAAPASCPMPLDAVLALSALAAAPFLPVFAAATVAADDSLRRSCLKPPATSGAASRRIGRRRTVCRNLATFLASAPDAAVVCAFAAACAPLAALAICARVVDTSCAICPSAPDWPPLSARLAPADSFPTAPMPPDTACPTLLSADPATDPICSSAPGSALRIDAAAS